MPARLSACTLACLVAFNLAGCETVVDVELPAHERQLVAQGFFAPESLWVVRVSHTVGYTEPSLPGWVDDATVEVWEGDRLVERLARSDTGTYAGTGNPPQPGRRYTLRVAAPGYEAVEGADALPSAPRVAAFEPALVAGVPPGRRVIRLRLTLDDPPGEPNRYALAVLHFRALVDSTGAVTSLPPALFPFTSSDPALGDPIPNPLDPDDPVYYQALLRDDGFDGQRKMIDAEIAYDAPGGGSPEVRRGFIVLLASLSEDLYRYAETAPAQALFGENPFSEPLRVHSNLSNGYGLFGGFWPEALPVPPDSLLPIVL